MSRQAVIRVKDLVAGYGEDIILDRISFDVYEGEIFVVLGGKRVRQEYAAETPYRTYSTHFWPDHD